MNRLKKEEIRKYKEARKGLSDEQIKALDVREAIKAFIEQRARSIHVERFPEEYDYLADSVADAADRSRGINPMSAEYITEVNKKRQELGIEPLTPSGYADSDRSLNLCRHEALQEVERIRIRIDEILFYKWDPIRLSNSNTARGEYTMYVEEVLYTAIAHETPQPLAIHLSHLRTEVIGARPPADEGRDLHVAQLIYAILHNRDYYPDHPVVEID